jgi:hypothetical protein
MYYTIHPLSLPNVLCVSVHLLPRLLLNTTSQLHGNGALLQNVSPPF